MSAVSAVFAAIAATPGSAAERLELNIYACLWAAAESESDRAMYAERLTTALGVESLPTDCSAPVPAVSSEAHPVELVTHWRGGMSSERFTALALLLCGPEVLP